jgi:hypothetical protein
MQAAGGCAGSGEGGAGGAREPEAQQRKRRAQSTRQNNKKQVQKKRNERIVKEVQKAGPRAHLVAWVDGGVIYACGSSHLEGFVLDREEGLQKVLEGGWQPERGGESQTGASREAVLNAFQKPEDAFGSKPPGH